MANYTWSYSEIFKNSLPHYTKDEKKKVVDFILTYQDHGLSDFSKYKGKISRTGSGNCSPEMKAYCEKHNLWHYHVGIPVYTQAPHNKYMTSRDVLHFQWVKDSTHIRIVDMYRHYLLDGKFYVPEERLILDEKQDNASNISVSVANGAETLEIKVS